AAPPRPGPPPHASTTHPGPRARLDLSPFTGSAATAVRLRFRLRSDGSNTFDGFRFDDMRVVVYDPAGQPALVGVGSVPPHALALLAPAPNPARRGADIAFLVPAGPGRVRLPRIRLRGRRVAPLQAGDPTPGLH